MCGFAGFLSAGTARAQGLAVLQEMTGSLRHRGPDDADVWADETAGAFLGFRRLAIVDLSPAGRQPMISRSGRYVVTYNGEIYNHLDLKAALEEDGAVPWRGHSDTEVLVEAIDRYGFAAALERLNGMFAIAAWDRQQARLLLARDRFGEKPLYYGRQGDRFLFASEPKALRCHPQWRGAADPNALRLFLRLGYVPAPYSAWQGIAKLPQGCWLSVDAAGNHAEPQAYWRPVEAAARAAARPFAGDFDEALDTLQDLLGDAVRMRTIADVPLGSFLSGGIDSSLVTALLQAQAGDDVRSFCVGFPDPKQNEAPYALAAARHLGTSHTELEVSLDDLKAVIPRLPQIYDEPFADASQIPTVVLCARARAHVTVALSGDGGDELFGGYGRYARAPQDWQHRADGSAARRRLAGLGLQALAGRPGNLPRRLRRNLRPLAADRPETLYADHISWWPPGELGRIGPAEQTLPFPTAPEGLQQLEPLSFRFTVLDAVSYLPDDLEVKIDRASMASSLEVRAPLLDHRIAEFAWSLPSTWKVAGAGANDGKLILRRLLARFLPAELIDRPKQGFEPPVGRWLRDDLRDWAEALLAPASLAGSGLLEPAVVRARWQEHLSGRRNWAYPLWVVLMLQAWRAENG